MGVSPRAPWDDDFPPAPRAPRDVDARVPPPPPKKRGRRPVAPRPDAAKSAPAWQYHRLAVAGPAGRVADFAAAARGPGIVHWHIDLRAVEEDIFHLAALPRAVRDGGRRGLSLEGCRILARQFAERVAARQARAAALLGQSRACPLDLHALLPVPGKILALGPSHPESLTWLRRNWGTTDTLRQVSALPHPVVPPRRLAAGQAAIGFGFFIADAPPRAALARLGARWQGLTFALSPPPGQ